MDSTRFRQRHSASGAPRSPNASSRALTQESASKVVAKPPGEHRAAVKASSVSDKALQGNPGAVTVLHTHARQLDYHPHVHLVMPTGTIDTRHRRWPAKRGHGNPHTASTIRRSRRSSAPRCWPPSQRPIS